MGWQINWWGECCVCVCFFWGGGGGAFFTLHTFYESYTYFTFFANRGNIIYNLSCYPHLGFVNSYVTHLAQLLLSIIMFKFFQPRRVLFVWYFGLHLPFDEERIATLHYAQKYLQVRDSYFFLDCVCTKEQTEKYSLLSLHERIYFQG